MNQVHRIGLGVAGVAAILTVAGALVVDGYVTAHQDVAQATASQDPTAVASLEPTASPTTNTDPVTIYVNPLPTQPVRVTKPATVVAPVRPVAAPPVNTPQLTAPPAPVVTPPTIRVIVPSPTGEDGNDN